MSNLKCSKFNMTSSYKFLSLLPLVTFELILASQITPAVIKFPKSVPKYTRYDLITAPLTTRYLGFNTVDECRLLEDSRLKNKSKDKSSSNKKCLRTARKIS